MPHPLSHDPVFAEYGRLAAEYDRRWGWYVEATVRETLARADLPPGARVLDVGCGTGALLAEIRKARPDTVRTGVDPVPAMLAQARARLGEETELVEARAEELPYRDARFDVVVSSSAFHTFQNPGRAAREMARVLRPGGRLVLTDWCADFLSIRLLGLWVRLIQAPPVRLHSVRDATHLLARAGFRDIRADRYRVSWVYGMMTVTATRQA